MLTYAFIFTTFIFIDFSKIEFLTETAGLKFNSSGGYVLELPAFLVFFLVSAIFLLVAGSTVILVFRITKHLYTHKSFNLSLFVFLFAFFVLHDIHSITGVVDLHSVEEIVKSYMQVVLSYCIVRMVIFTYNFIGAS